LSGVGSLYNAATDNLIVTTYATGNPTYVGRGNTNLSFDGSILSVTGSIATTGDITAGGNVTAYSDVRLKKDIETIDNPLDKIRQMRGVYFTMNTRRRTGVIAQETEVVLPEVVFTDLTPERRKSVDYGNIVGLLIEGIKALDNRLSAIEKNPTTK